MKSCANTDYLDYNIIEVSIKCYGVCAANTGSGSNVGLRLANHLICRPKIKQSLAQCLVFAGLLVKLRKLICGRYDIVNVTYKHDKSDA